MTRVLVALALAACSKSPPEPDKCERVARRLMPDPEPQFLASCRARLGDAAFERTVDCVLAIPGPITRDEQVEACEGSAELPLYFQF